MTIEELRQKEEENKQKAKERQEYLKEKKWFVSIPRETLYDGESGNVIMDFEDVEELLESYERDTGKSSCKVKVEFLYRTNKWKENLRELD